MARRRRRGVVLVAFYAVVTWVFVTWMRRSPAVAVAS